MLETHRQKFGNGKWMAKHIITSLPIVVTTIIIYMMKTVIKFVPPTVDLQEEAMASARSSMGKLRELWCGRMIESKN